MPEFISLPDGMSVVTAWFIVGATMLTSLIGGMFGIGGGTILLALLAILLPPVALIPIHAVVQFGATSSRTVLLLRHIERPTLLPFALGTALGSALSGVLFIQFPPWLIQYTVAAFVLWSIRGAVPAFNRKHIVLAGIVSGFLTMLFGATGTFVSAFIKGMRLPSLRHVGTHAAMMAMQHGLKILVFGTLGFAFGPYLPLLALMLISSFVGTLLGRKVLMRIAESWFKPVLNSILLLLALRLIWQATGTLLAAV